MKAPDNGWWQRPGGGGRAGCVGAALISLSPPRGRTRWDGRGFAPVAHLIQGPLRGQRLGGACRSEGSVGRQHVPDRLGEAAGQVDLGDLGAALATQPGLGAPVALGVDGVAGGMYGGFDQCPAQVLGSVAGPAGRGGPSPRTGRPADRDRCNRPAWSGWQSGRCRRSPRRWCSRAPSRSRGWSSAAARTGDRHPSSAARAHTR